MYIPADFEITDPDTILAFLREHPFGMLVINGEHGVPVISHLPFLLRFDGEQLIVEGHLARANEQEAYLAGGTMASMVVSGAHGYVSSGVYGHVNVPTYNYQAVHLTGTVSVMNEQELLEHLKQVVAEFEKERPQPLDFDRWPLKMIAHYMDEITGFRLTVEKTEAAFKLSQNRNATDFANIVADLQNGNPDQVRLAEEMIKMTKSSDKT
jgi:transcriptional regulator